MQCALYDAGRCRSCQWITQPIPEQLSAKTADLKNLLADFPVEEWCAPVSGPEQGFRNKAKMVVSGSVENHCSVCCIEMVHRKTFVTARFIQPHLRPFCGAKTLHRPCGFNTLQRGA